MINGLMLIGLGIYKYIVYWICLYIIPPITRGAGTILYVEGSTNQNKFSGKSGGGGPIYRRFP